MTIPPASGSALRNLIRRGGIGPVQSAGHEILRRIFVTARDANWQEVPCSVWETEIDESRRTVVMSARHTSSLVDFEWRGRFYASDTLRTLRFAFEARALRDIEVCRIGLVILHGVDSTVGAQVKAEGPYGEQRLMIARRIHPQPLIAGVPGAMTEPFSELTIERSDFGVLKLHLTGDLFELEDQRNWGDASFKTYCTPLRLGFPRSIGRGSIIQHAVEVSFEPATADEPATAERGKTQKRFGPSSVPMRPSTAARAVRCFPAAIDHDGVHVPAIGRICPDRPGSATRRPSGLLGWDHLQVHLDQTTPSQLAQLLDDVPSATQLEIVLPLAEEAEVAPDQIQCLQECAGRTARILVRGLKDPLPSTRAVAQLRDLLKGRRWDRIPVFVLPNGHFVEFNRRRPLDLDVDGVAFPLSSAVHADDEETILENVAAAHDMVLTARALSGKARICISPLALRATRDADRRPFPDSLWAPWLTAMIARLTAAGVDAITLGRDLVEPG